ncbi:MAG: hypothetical protein Q4A07_08525 [Coriobacteriales bacterium]|nr:hypothetical protein [Coriobacteriales bacterium]
MQRVHGSVSLANPNDVGGRLAYHYEEKLLIARAAARRVPDGSTIMVESGSCCALLARELADVKDGVTILTNSAFIANYVRDSSRVACTLMGGSYQRDSQVMVGPLVCAQEVCHHVSGGPKHTMILLFMDESVLVLSCVACFKRARPF